MTNVKLCFTINKNALIPLLIYNECIDLMVYTVSEMRNDLEHHQTLRTLFSAFLRSF